jgi:radical SAM superfamily enzyme YgiQ (UPF0313 family)
MSILMIYAKHPMLKEVGREREVASYSRDDVTPPLGLLHLGGALKAANLPVQILDDSLTDDDEIRQRLKACRYFGISSLTPNVPRALELIRMGRDAGCRVIVGGAHASSDPPYFLERGADFVVIGEGEHTLPELIKTLDGEGELGAVKGIGFMENGTPRFTEPRPLERDLDALPGPAWDLIDIEQYYRAMGFRVFITMATRGCPYACIFCNKTMSPRQYRKRDPAKVAEEVESYLKKFRCERVYFVDDLFTCDKNWVLAFCKEVLRRKLKFVWECESRINHVNLNLLMTMRKAGCIKIHFGVESGSERILKSINKKITPEQILEAAKMARLASIWYKFFLLLGFPWERREDLDITREMVFKAMPDNLAISLLIPMPGSAVWNQIQDRLYPDALKFDGLHYYHRKPSYKHDNLSHEELAAFRDELIRDYESFHKGKARKMKRFWEKAAFAAIHPSYLLKKLGIL